jgi:riboflavin kinase/FMN adenylyltransferase
MRITRHLQPHSTHPPAALTIGNFDGVHFGHTAILTQLLDHAQCHGLTPTVITFEPHPKVFFAHKNPQSAPTKIVPLRNKLALFAKLGIEHVVILPFNTALASMSATDFVSELLLNRLNMRHLLIGDDFQFGAQRAGNFSLLQQMSAAHGFTLNAVQSVYCAEQRASSSHIRTLIAQGNIASAVVQLGHPLQLSGRVIYGQQLGRTINCPTINLKMPANLAAQGVFAADIHLNGQNHQGVASIGTRPSVKTNGQCWLEVHIFDFNQNVYGQLAHVTLRHKIRDELKFTDLPALQHAIDDDISQAHAFFANHPNPSHKLG